MTTHPSLFDAPPAACRHAREGNCALCEIEADYPSTRITRAAAEREIAPHASTLREDVFKTIAAFGPICDERIARVLNMNPSTERPRRLELEKAGRIMASGTTRTASGRKAVTFVVVRAH